MADAFSMTFSLAQAGEAHQAMTHALEAEQASPAAESKLLAPDFGTAFWTLTLFILLLVFLGKFVWPKILGGLQAREEKIRSDISGAEAANKAAQKTLADYQAQLADAQSKVRKMLDEARADADALGARRTAEIETQIAAMQKRAAADINQARTAAVQELYARAAELSVAVAEKILQRQITEADTKALIDQSLKEMDKLKVG